MLIKQGTNTKQLKHACLNTRKTPQKCVCGYESLMRSPSLLLALVEVEVKLLCNRQVFLLDFDADLAHVCLRAIVEATIIKDKLHVVHEVLDLLIFVLLQFSSYRLEVHWVLNDSWVVRNIQCLVVDRHGKDLGL